MKNPDHMATYLSKFHTICEAYEVLSNLQTKTIYDQFGADVLLQGTQGPDGVYRGGYTYQQNCYEIFDNFFLKNNPFHDICDN